jgi:hypothetical protein
VNQYGKLTMRYWQRWHPGQYAIIRDRGEFFTEMGEMIADEINELSNELAGDDPPCEGYLAKLTRLEAARAIAEELMLLPYRAAPADGGSGQR